MKIAGLHPQHLLQERDRRLQVLRDVELSQRRIAAGVVVREVADAREVGGAHRLPEEAEADPLVRVEELLEHPRERGGGELVHQDVRRRVGDRRAEADDRLVRRGRIERDGRVGGPGVAQGERRGGERGGEVVRRDVGRGRRSGRVDGRPRVARRRWPPVDLRRRARFSERDRSGQRHSPTGARRRWRRARLAGGRRGLRRAPQQGHGEEQASSHVGGGCTGQASGRSTARAPRPGGRTVRCAALHFPSFRATATRGAALDRAMPSHNDLDGDCGATAVAFSRGE